MTNGIYTLANDVVYDQVVALLNSIEVNLSPEFPVWIIPYDNRLDKIKDLVKSRNNVELLSDEAILSRWEDFAYEIWKRHPSALANWQSRGIEGVNRLGMHRRFCAFDEDSPLEKFIYCDGDVLVLNQLDFVFDRIKDQEFVVYDFQYKDLTHVYNIHSEKVGKIFPQERLSSEIFCAGFYGSKRGLFPQETREWLLQQLESGEAEILYPNGPDQSILNYMTMRSDRPAYNFSLQLPKEQTTGCSVTSPHFEQRGHLLYDKGVQLTYLHYIGISSKVFTRLCAGENIDFPYRDIFLHYRYLHDPENRPQFVGKPKPYNAPPTFIDKVLRKLGMKTSRK
ncbi:Npun_R2821/Npun_R2822 family protein [Roseofilum capinflatum]|uniref:Sugar transferase n=1 Tax=Roseofilum capinflatum BLCC-M114 TaxID=3022440 RepID=A0ABT7B100_9CYAN|nr:Npun_R2821/Npun_R2822 family protein [Roseofilum capinflatum]MDJ1172842.1 sugar transferase [Roseofilum capinflatum BLCC-M114]